MNNQGSIFDKMKAKATAEKQDEITDLERKQFDSAIESEKAKSTLPPEQRPPPPEPQKRSARRDNKLQKEVTNLKTELLEIRSLIAEITRERTIDQPNRKLTFEEFVEHMLSHVDVGNHYSGYVKQYTGETTGTGRPKKSNFNHIYMIYLDLP